MKAAILILLSFVSIASAQLPGDSDSDGLPDTWEALNGLNPLDSSGPNGPSGDPDNDLLNNLQEFLNGTDPNNSDTDFDSLQDADEIFIFNTDPLNPDTDGDNLNDGDEVGLHNTDPLNPDSDGDSFNDATEINLGYDPNDPSSTPPPPPPANPTEDLDLDGLNALTEYLFGTSDSIADPNPATISKSGGNLTFSFPRSTTNTGASWEIEVSDDSTTWTTDPSAYSLQPPTTLPDGRIKESLIFNTGFTQKFVRLKITTNP